MAKSKVVEEDFNLEGLDLGEADELDVSALDIFSL